MKKKDIKIATILPYKENYTYTKASAASLWVSEFFRKSKFRTSNYIYGHTKYKDFLSKNYINIDLKNIKSKLKSATKEYSKKLIKKFKKQNYDLIEIHNRPLILKEIIKNIDSRYIIYFHNDPLSMKGSKTIKERLNIISNVEKIIFVSEWTQKRFFINLDDKLRTKTEIVYPSINPKKKITRKKNYITFVGKLNESKGYDIFSKSIIKILDEFPEWRAFSLGDEDRRKIFIKHPNHFELGFIKHSKVCVCPIEIPICVCKKDPPFRMISRKPILPNNTEVLRNRKSRSAKMRVVEKT